MFCPEPKLVKDHGNGWGVWWCARCKQETKTLTPEGMKARGNHACVLNIPCRCGLGDRLARVLVKFIPQTCKACARRQMWLNRFGWECDKLCWRVRNKLRSALAEAIYGFVRCVDGILLRG